MAWAIARRSAAPGFWASCSVLAAARRVVMEGSTIVEVARPDLLLFVAHPFLPPERWKQGSTELLARADAVVVNCPAGERAHRAPP